MKPLSWAVCIFVFGLALLEQPVGARVSSLLGAKECTWGPGYWCLNFGNAKNCHAVRHCIQAVWEKQTVEKDSDSVCQICLNMVKQARDQLQSNETQNDLKEVFEGSCKLIVFRSIRRICIKTMDDFTPELVEALASEMNPEVVCSVAGLCNNSTIDDLLAAAEGIPSTTEEPQIAPTPIPTPTAGANHLSCTGCNKIATIITEKFQSKNRDDVLENMLLFCRQMSSYTDACSNIVLSYFNDIYDGLKERLTSDGICHISGVCAAKYHQHPELVEIRPMSNVGVIPVKDDIPCELCEQLVTHLKELLVANTTEEEFKTVLEGLCGQTKEFKEECISIVDQYYDKIYQTLVNNLDSNGACFMIGVCPKNTKNDDGDQPIAPLLPTILPQKMEVTIKQLSKKKMLGENEPILTREEIQSAQLPFDTLMGAPHAGTLVNNGQTCTLCEYFLHFAQESLSEPTNEDKIKEVVATTCNKMPKTISEECHNFVQSYGDAVIALLIQSIDPSQVCPMLKMCPQHVDDMEVFNPRPVDVSIMAKSTSAGDKPSCPLCLFAVEQVKNVVKNDTTEENIENALHKLCSHLSKNLQAECIDFVDTYSKELISLMMNDFTSKQICVYIKLCDDNKPDLSELNIHITSEEDTITNEIPDNTINGHPAGTVDKEYIPTPECLLCQRVMKEVEKRVINYKSKEQIKNALEHACDKMHKIQAKCRSYVEKYSDKIIDLIQEDVPPKQLCRFLEMCLWREVEDLDIDEALKIDVIAIPSFHPMTAPSPVGDSPQCVICEFTMAKLETELRDKKTQEEIKHTIQNICSKMPKTVSVSCKKFVDQYADLILNLLDSMPPKQICQEMQLCSPTLGIITDEVVECGVCHGAVANLHPLVKASDLKHFEHDYLIDHSCDSLPAKYFEKCSELITYYGESIVNLIRFGTSQEEICGEIGKCFKQEQSRYAYLTLTNEKGNAIVREMDIEY